MKFNKNQTLGFTSKLSDFEIVNQEFIRCKCYMLATGDNVNGSDITLESVQKAMARGEFYNKPVVAHLYRDPEDNNKWRVGGHDSKWVITNTSFDIVNECIPFGVIPESSNLQLEEVLESDGETVNKYLTCQIILWVGRYNIMDAAYSDDIYFNQSCELSINEYHYKDNDVLAIDDFTFSALCLLNKSDDQSKNVRPCFPSCRVEKMKAFSIDTDKFKQNFELMLEKLKQYESDGITTAVQNNVINEPNKEEKKFMDLEKMKSFLSTFTVGEGENATEQYALISATENSFTVMDKHDGLRIYTVEFALDDDDNIAADWDGKVERKLSVVDFETENAVSIREVIDFEEIVNRHVDEKALALTDEFTKAFNKEVESKDSAYAELNNKYTSAMARLAEYESAEKEAERISHKNEIDRIVSDFAKKIGRSPKFLVYKAKLNADEVTTEQVMQDLTLMVGQEMVNKSASFSYQPQEVNVATKTADEVTNRYGHLLDKYRK